MDKFLYYTILADKVFGPYTSPYNRIQKTTLWHRLDRIATEGQKVEAMLEAKAIEAARVPAKAGLT
jgi:hypothetical protein